MTGREPVVRAITLTPASLRLLAINLVTDDFPLTPATATRQRISLRLLARKKASRAKMMKTKNVAPQRRPASWLIFLAS